MKKTIRTSVFETNSSSMHAICFVSGEEYEKLQDGELIIAGIPSAVGLPSSNDPAVVPVDEALAYLKAPSRFGNSEYSDREILGLNYCYWEGGWNDYGCGEAFFAEVPGSNGELYAAAIYVSDDDF